MSGAGSAAGAESCRWHRRSRRRLPHQGVRGDRARWEVLRRAMRWPLPHWALTGFVMHLMAN